MIGFRTPYTLPSGHEDDNEYDEEAELKTPRADFVLVLGFGLLPCASAGVLRVCWGTYGLGVLS